MTKTTKVQLRLPDKLHGQLKSEAATKQIPLYKYILDILKDFVERNK